MSRILLLGGSGILGSEVLNQLQVSNIDYVSPRSSDLDIRDRGSLESFIADFKPNWIINCAAWTNVDGAEDSFDSALELNSLAVKNIAEVAKKYECPVVHISTDYVFDGESSDSYSETAPVNPVNRYGQSKLQGETALLEAIPERAYIIRTSWLYGTTGKNFVKSILKNALAEGRIQVIQDQVGSPTNSEDLARGIIALLQQPPPAGIYHFSNLGEISWYEFAVRIYELAGRDVRLVEPIASTIYSSKVKRPSHSVLSTDKWSKTEITKIVEWDDSLAKIFPRILDSVQKETKL